MDTPRVRARQVFFVFCLHPSPPCLTSWLTVDCRWRQRRFLPSPPVTYISSLDADGKYCTKMRKKQWTLIKNVPTFMPKPTTIQATPAQRWRQRWTQTFTFSFTASIWFTAPYTSRWRVKAKNENCGVRTRSRARGNVRFDNTRQSFEKYCCPVKV